jgi:hypothetical protein
MLVQVLQVLALTRTQRLPVVCYHLDDELMSTLRQLPDIEILDQPERELSTLPAAAAETADRALRGEQELWIELRRDALGAQDRLRALRGRIRLAVVAVCVFCAALGAAFLVRAHRYDRQTELAVKQSAKIYREIFPQGNVPPGVRSRLESELTKVKGIRGDSAELPSSPPALDVLCQMLAALPNNLRYRILEIRIDEGRLDVNGEVREHGDADKIATLLREHGFEVSAPSTQRQSSKSVTVRITAHRTGQPNSTNENPT